MDIFNRIIELFQKRDLEKKDVLDFLSAIETEKDIAGNIQTAMYRCNAALIMYSHPISKLCAVLKEITPEDIHITTEEYLLLRAKRDALHQEHTVLLAQNSETEELRKEIDMLQRKSEKLKNEILELEKGEST